MFLVKAETLQGGMLINDSDDDKYKRAGDDTIPFMQAAPSKVAPSDVPLTVELEQISDAADSSIYKIISG